jgi:hypothetical protein
VVYSIGQLCFIELQSRKPEGLQDAEDAFSFRLLEVVKGFCHEIIADP